MPVLHEPKNGNARRELFDLEADPAEMTNLFNQQTTLAEKLQTRLREWQSSVLTSLIGSDYRK